MADVQLSYTAEEIDEAIGKILNLPQVDWEENDDTKLQHIKGRTHYISSKTEIYSQENITISSGNITINTGTLVFVPDKVTLEASFRYYFLKVGENIYNPFDILDSSTLSSFGENAYGMRFLKEGKEIWWIIGATGITGTLLIFKNITQETIEVNIDLYNITTEKLKRIFLPEEIIFEEDLYAQDSDIDDIFDE